MNEHELRLLSRAVMSLTTSTDVVFRHGVYTARVSGRNSPYVTHRKVEYAHSDPDVEGFLRVSNGRFEVLVEPCPEPEPPLAVKIGGVCYMSTWTLVQVPRPVVLPLLREAERWLGFTIRYSYPMVRVAIADRVVVGWQGGKPVFEPASIPTPALDGVEVGPVL